ncbi:hypothetical protein [Christiangramia sp.]|uniref:hypothetical protein n=1 Tax=Christiangramia sp. TaxID=1931228 RepID=UPI00260FC3B6|nr:hypothetical protein [Christiangramia sp.]
MNFGLAREIYGVSPWHVDVETLPSLLSIVENHPTMEIPEVQYNTPAYLVFNDSKLISRPYQLRNTDNFTGIGLININGPITVSGGASSMGMRQVRSMMLEMSNDNRIKSFLVVGDSGGGSSAGVEIMTDTISLVSKSKSVYGIIEKGGMACSAMYGIMSACKAIYAESEMSLVGSCGTMMQFEGRAANSEHEGKKHIRLYASRSTEKNKEIEDALNEDNYKLLYDNLLNPINERFLNLIESNRPALKASGFDTGKALFAKDAVGTFIDGIKSMGEVVQMIEQEIKMPTPAGRGINSINNHVMTVDQLKQDHPETYNSIFKAGVKSEAGRTKAWMVHAESDLEKVKSGIESGEEISSADTQELILKSFSRQHVKDMETESVTDVKTEESKGSEGEKSELDQFNSKLDEMLKNA